MIYKFCGFLLDSEQKSLTFNNKEVALTKKSYQLLEYLLQNPNKPVSREQLIEHVWNNRVVTDNTIDQCISKLRKLLNSVSEKEYIKSIYGHGISFVPRVTTVSLQQKNKYRFIITVFVAVFIVAVFYFKENFLNTKAGNQSVVQTQGQTGKTERKLTILPVESDSIAENQRWFSDGNMYYLNELLAKNLQMKAVSAKPEWLKSNDKQILAINLLDNNQTDWVLLNESLFDGTVYKSSVTLRDRNGIIAEYDFTAEKIQSLMQQIAVWTKNEIETEIIEIRPPMNNLDLSEDDYALESYIRAMSLQQKGDSQKAITFLQAAVEQDRNFYLAWYELAIAWRKQGNYDKALAILNSLENMSDSLAFKVALVIGHTYDGQRKFSEAQKSYDSAYQLAFKSGNEKQIASLRLSQAISLINTQDFKLADKYLEEVLNVTDEETQAHFYGVLMNTYAKLAKAEKRYTDAIRFAQKSISAFVRSGDKRYEMQSKTRLASLFIKQAEFDQAEELSMESLVYAQSQNQLRSISSNHFKLAFIYQRTGRFQQAKQHWEKAMLVNSDLGIADEKAAIYEYLVDLHVMYDYLDEAANYLQRLNEFSKNNTSETIRSIVIRTQLILALAKGEKDSARKLLSEYHKFSTLSDDSNSIPIEIFKGDLSVLDGNNTDAEKYYLSAIEFLQNSGDNVQLAAVMNKLTVIYLETDVSKAKFNLNQTEQYKPFVYPFLKYKAILNYRQGRILQAVSQLQELKLKSGDFWKPGDQLLMEHYQQSINTNENT